MFDSPARVMVCPHCHKKLIALRRHVSVLAAIENIATGPGIAEFAVLSLRHPSIYVNMVSDIEGPGKSFCALNRVIEKVLPGVDGVW